MLLERKELKAMKKIMIILMSMMLIFTLAACSNSRQSGNDETKASKTQEDSLNSKSEDTGAGASEKSSAQADENSDGSDAGNEDENKEKSKKTLVVYYSASGNTKEAANYIAEAANADIFELEPVKPYTDDDLEWTDDDSRVVYEHNNPDDREVELVETSVPDWEEYDTVFIGYPIWWHTAPMIIGTFLESYDLSGVEVYPFAQSASMDMEQFENSMEFVRDNAHGASVHDGLFVNASDIEGILEYLVRNGFGE